MPNTGMPYVRYARTQENILGKRDTIAYDQRLFYCLDGTATIVVDNVPYSMQKGSLLIWQSGIVYSCSKWENMHAIALNFDYESSHREQKTPIPPDSVGLFAPDLVLEPMLGEEQTGLPLVFFAENMESIRPGLQRILEEYTCKQVYFEELCTAFLAEILYLCRRQYRIGATEKASPVAEHILRYIQSHIEEPISYEKIGSIFHYHPHHINRLVKKQTGKSFHQYVQSCRIDLAIHLLQTTDLSVGELAEKLHFADIKSFSRCFSRATGKAPTQYRTGSHGQAEKHLGTFSQEIRKSISKTGIL